MRRFLETFFALALAMPRIVIGCDALLFTDAWVREQLPGSSVAAAYVTVANRSENTIFINAVRSDCCDSLMMHETQVVDGVNRMRHLNRIAIAGGETFAFAPLGAHLMLFNPHNPLVRGQMIDITFECQQGEDATVKFLSRKP